MRRFRLLASSGILMIPLLVASAAWLPAAKTEASKGVAVTANIGTLPTPTGRLGSVSPVRANSNPTLAQVEWGRFPLQNPRNVATVVAAACLLLPFGLSMWGTLRKRI